VVQVKDYILLINDVKSVHSLTFSIIIEYYFVTFYHNKILATPSTTFTYPVPKS